MISIGIAQIPNSVDISQNYESIYRWLQKFETAAVDLVLFPECSLSGFTAKMRQCTLSALSSYLEKIQSWTAQTGIEVALPTAIVEADRVYNSGFWFKGKNRQKFFKTGLTESEKKFFSIPDNPGSKVFQLKGYNLGVLICFEVEQEPWTYFSEGQVDALLWPGYWRWSLQDIWGPQKDSAQPNVIYSNMEIWRMPILQSNFAYNDLEGHEGAGPEGLSFVIDHNNKLVHKGRHLESNGFVVCLDKIGDQTAVVGCRHL